MIKSEEKARRKIESIFMAQGVNQIKIQKKYLPEIFSADLLEISKKDGLPMLKPFVVEYFEINGIMIKFYVNEVEFKIEFERKKQLETLDNILRLKEMQIKTLENSLKIKNEKIKTLEKTIESMGEEIKKLTSSTVDPKIIKKKDAMIKQHKKKIEILNEELAKTYEDMENLKIEIEKLRKT